MSDNFSQRLSQFYTSDRLLWIIVFVGITLRLVRYLHNPSLWFDESVYAVDIINRLFSQFIQPATDWSSKPPYGFMIFEKLAVEAFGNSEYSLRLFPLLCGVVSVPLFCMVARHFISSRAVPVALGLFAILDPLIYQASNLKPYSGDLAFALIIFIAVIHIQTKRVDVMRSLLLGGLGAVIVWFSHPSIFVLAGVGVSMTLFYLRRKDRRTFGKLLIAFVMWAVSFLVYYFIYTRNLVENLGFGAKLLLQYEKAFIPFPPRSLSDIKWIIDNFFEIFSFSMSLNYPAGFPFRGLLAVAFLIGCVTIYGKNRESFIVLFSPIFFTLLAAILHMYPFKGRLIVFLVPFFLLFIAEGIEFMRNKISVDSKTVGLILIGVIFIYPVSWASYHSIKPSTPENIKPAINYIKNNWQDGDTIYVHYYAQYAFEYYTKYHPDNYAFHDNEYIIGIAPRGWYRTWRKQDISNFYDDENTTLQSNREILKIYMNDIEKLKGRNRVWFLFSSVIYKDEMREENFILFHLNTMGKQLRSFGTPGIASAYLYDLSGK